MPKKKPAYQLHKATGQAKVRLDGKDYYLGEYRTRESKERYDGLIEQWLIKEENIDQYRLSVDELCMMYVAFAKSYYQKNGSVTSEVGSIKHALRLVVELFGTTRAREFGPKKLKIVQRRLIDHGHVRSNINRMVERVQRMFKWASSEELLPIEIYLALNTVGGLKKGRSDAKESKPVCPVSEDIVEQTIPQLSTILGAAVKLIRLTGARSSEILKMRPMDISQQEDDVWTYVPGSHKTEHHGKSRRIFLGPQAIEILRPFLKRDPEEYCFSPKEAVAESRLNREANRVTPRKSTKQNGSQPNVLPRPFNAFYTKDSFRQAIQRAARRAGVPPWTPRQLRHSAGTLIRKDYGIDGARVVLGHSDSNVTEIYAERDFDLAKKIMSEIG